MEASNYRQAFKAAIARVYHTNGTIVGAGFLVTDQQLLTCAHVVTAALGLPTTLQDAPTDAVELDFPLIAPGQKVKARVRFWRPVQQPLSSPEAGEDMAGLVLESSPPVGCQPVRLVASSELWAHPFQIFGFPSQRDDGIWASGVIRDRLASGWVQIEDIKAQGHPVQPGFSGAPVWDEQVEGVVGMAVAADKKRDETRTAFMIPTSILSRAWTELGQTIQLPDVAKPKAVPSALNRVQQTTVKNLLIQLENLVAELEALNQALGFETNPVQRIRLERQMEAIAQERDKVAAKLDALGA